ncbi:MAG: BsuPI-related putative proteinase inhibitor [Halobacteriaceae archaeon]
MSLEADLDVRVGAAVTFVFTVANATPEAREVTYRGGLGADVAVYEAGQEVWRYSDGRAFAQALHTAVLEPGESVRHEATWPDPAPGEYTAEATLAATDADAAATASFSVQG